MARDAEEIKKDVVDQLYWDARVNAADVHVDVHDGKVVLRGSVPNLSARHFAATDALAVAGVTALENELKVKHPSSVTAPSDEQIRSSIEKLLEWNSSLDAEHVRVGVENGIVTLEGSVDAVWKKAHAEALISELTGVTAIVDKLACVPTKDTSDEIISEMVVNALKRNPTINDKAIEVRVANGVVRLSGAVPDWSARKAAYQTALNTFGVIGVDDQLLVAK